MTVCHRSRRMHIVTATLLLLLPAALGRLQAQSTPADSAILRARTGFDVLVGAWHVVSRTDATESTAAAGETYTFAKGLDGGMIVGNWRFNRGTIERPDVVDAVYYSGYDNASRTWRAFTARLRRER